MNARSIGADAIWSATATFRASQRGVIDLADSAPTSGSYRGVSAMGLFWSQDQVSSKPDAAGPFSTSSYMTQTEITLSAGRQRLASSRVIQSLIGRGVGLHVERLGSTGFVGVYFTPPSRHVRRPATVIWGGSEGGLDIATWAAMLASHGIPALALAYFAEPGLPANLTRIPLEYFVKAIRWLRGQPGVDPNRIWLLSGSRGSEAELLVASHWPSLVHGLVATSPSAFVYGGLGCLNRYGCPSWTLHGRPLPAARATARAEIYHSDGSVSDVAAFRAGLADKAVDRAARIPIEHFRGPVCLLTGGDDQLWPSDYYAAQIVAALRHNPAPHVDLNYPRAGHLVFNIPYAALGGSVSATAQEDDQLIDLGGSPAGNEAAHVSDWPFVLRFIASD